MYMPIDQQEDLRRLVGHSTFLRRVLYLALSNSVRMPWTLVRSYQLMARHFDPGLHGLLTELYGPSREELFS